VVITIGNEYGCFLPIKFYWRVGRGGTVGLARWLSASRPGPTRPDPAGAHPMGVAGCRPIACDDLGWPACHSHVLKRRDAAVSKGFSGTCTQTRVFSI